MRCCIILHSGELPCLGHGMLWNKQSDSEISLVRLYGDIKASQIIFLDILTLVNGTDKLFRNVGSKTLHNGPGEE